MDNYLVYHLSIEGEELPFYVGKGKPTRPSQHFWPSSLKYSNMKNYFIKKAIRENKKVNIIIIRDNLSNDEANSLEIEEIKRFGRLDNQTGILTNHTWGGDGQNGWHVSEETKQKISESQIGDKHWAYGKRGAEAPAYGMRHTKEQREKFSSMRSGEGNAMYAKKHTDETKSIMSEKKKNLKPTEHCDKCGKYFTKSIYVQFHGEKCGIIKTNKNLSNALKLVPKVECAYCGLKTTPGNNKRWHGENCKMKNKE